jgi:hypothetical protein
VDLIGSFDETLNVHDCKDMEIELYSMPHRGLGNRKKATWSLLMFQTYSEYCGYELFACLYSEL